VLRSASVRSIGTHARRDGEEVARAEAVAGDALRLFGYL
jgi:hypothetical protein